MPESTSDARANNPPELRRAIGLFGLVLYGLGSTVGAGIYALTGAVAGRAGMHAPIAFGISSLLALCTALSFADLSSRFPEAGGALVFVREGLRIKSLSVVVGLFSAMAGAVSAATVSLAFVGYLAEILAVPQTVVLAVVVGGVGGIAAWGVRESVIVAGAVTIVEIAGLLAIIAFGIPHLASAPLSVQPIEILPLALNGAEWHAVLGASVLGFYAYLGFEDMVNVAEEVKDVRRALPKAILLTLTLSTVLYVGVSVIAVLVVPPTELAASKAPLSLVFERSGGSGELLAMVALAAMLNGALVQIVMASRILLSLSRQGSLPSRFGVIHSKRRTPVFATFLVTLCVGVLALLFPLESLAATTAAIALAVFVLVNLSLVAIRLRETDQHHTGTMGNIPLMVPIAGGVFSLLFLLIEIVRLVRA